MKGVYEAARLSGALVHERCDRRDELAHVMRGFGFAAHWVSSLDPRMIVHQNEHVLEVSVTRAGERSSDVGVYESAH
eukprot:158690-Pleurochrysis_carterae.AAC.1